VQEALMLSRFTPRCLNGTSSPECSLSSWSGKELDT
jgi:hypothetical protein